MTTNDNHHGEHLAREAQDYLEEYNRLGEEQARENLLPKSVPSSHHHNRDHYVTPGSVGTKERRKFSLGMVATMIVTFVFLALALLATSLPMFLKMLLCAPIAFMAGACITHAIGGRYTDSDE
ncbi:hypothetical protein [Rothia mucilaginosa]|uniref:hypothetical protein n=1 Tax=Rothia mucilaginosa TaxID=43675 RepID=UPI003C7E3189